MAAVPGGWDGEEEEGETEGLGVGDVTDEDVPTTLPALAVVVGFPFPARKATAPIAASTTTATTAISTPRRPVPRR